MKELRDSHWNYYEFTVDDEFGYIFVESKLYEGKQRLDYVDDISYPLWNLSGYEIKDEKELREYLTN